MKRLTRTTSLENMIKIATIMMIVVMEAGTMT